MVAKSLGPTNRVVGTERRFGRVVAHSEVTSQIAQSGDYSREVAICLGIGAKCVNSSAFSGTYFCSTVASTQESTSTTTRLYVN